MPVYKRRRYLREAIWSILAQTFTDWELVIVDDGSEDEAVLGEALLAAAEDERLVLLRVERNMGEGVSCGPALNAGFRVARGAYHTWATDDNIWFPDCYARLVAALDAGADFVYAPQMINGVGRAALFHMPYDPATFELSCRPGTAFAYRRGLYERAGNYAFVWDTDFDMWKRIHMLEPQPVFTSLEPPPGAIYRDHDDTITQRMSER